MNAKRDLDPVLDLELREESADVCFDRRNAQVELLGRLEPYLNRLSTVVIIALAQGPERTALERGIENRGIACTTLLVDDELAAKIRDRKELAWTARK